MVKGFTGSVLENLLSFFLPPICMKCKTETFNKGGFCKNCWNDFIFLGSLHCDQCAEPVVENGICLACQYHPPAYDHARSLFIYNEEIKPLILALKYNKADYYGVLFGRLMGQLIKKESINYHYILPVPLHWKRFLGRGYNQSTFLAKEAAKICQLPWNPHLLYRKAKEEKTQAGLMAVQRRENVKKAFILKNPKEIQGKNIILIDDVMASGATLEACSYALKEKGATKVLALTLAKTVKR
jgi:ComF family protein